MVFIGEKSIKSVGAFPYPSTKQNCCVTQQLETLRGRRRYRAELMQSSLEALADSDTCKHGKVSGIRGLLRGLQSMERQLKPLPRLITKLLRQEAALTSFIHLKRHLTRWSRSLNFIEKVNCIHHHQPWSAQRGPSWPQRRSAA